MMESLKSRTPYDDVFYPGHVYEHTHPNHLATLARLYGMSPAPVERCRVLDAPTDHWVRGDVGDAPAAEVDRAVVAQ